MTTTTRMRTRRIAAAGLIGAVVLAVGASAAAAPVIDPTETGSLTVHKYEAPDGALPDLPNDGSEIVGGVPGVTPLPGVEFTIYEVEGIDLSTNAGWEAAAALQATFDPASVLPGAALPTPGGYALDTGTAVTTDDDGEAFFDDLDLALYLVVETGTPAGFTPVQSFMVTVPVTVTDPDTDEQGWVYDVHVYPKNPTFTPTKTVVDAEDTDPDTDGEQITYTIQSSIPAVGMDAFQVVDTLGAALAFDEGELDHLTVAVVSPPTDPPADPLASLVRGTDFTLAVDGQTITIALLPPGIDAALEATDDEPNALISIDLTVTVGAVGEISNTAVVFPSQTAITRNLGTATAAVESRWGTISIDKTSSDSTVTDLSGATFELYYTNSDEWDGDPEGAGVTQVVIDGETEFETVDGDVSIAPLRYSDFANGAVITPASPDYRYYWLREVVALDGHQLLAAPVQVVIADAAGPDAVNVVEDIVNVPTNAGFELPFTGGMGTIWFTIAGVLLISGATLLLIRQRRSRA